MSDDDDDFDGEKTQIFLPGKDKPGATAPDHSGDREGIQLKPRSAETTDKADSDVDFDITGEHAKADTPAAPQATAGTAAPKRPPPAVPASASPSPIVIVAVLMVIAAIAYLMLR